MLKNFLKRLIGVRRPLINLYKSLPVSATVLDVGCFNYVQYKLAHEIGRLDLNHSGVDFGVDESTIPVGFTFRKCDLNHNSLPFEDDSFDLVVASHVIEHLTDPIKFFAECVRVCKPGGQIYIEAPSERSVLFPGMTIEREKMFCTSFYDDPTHMGRPWSPQAMIRLAAYYGCSSISADYYTSLLIRVLSPLLLPLAYWVRMGKLFEFVVWNTIGWAAYAVLQKPVEKKGLPEFRYFIPSRN
jgi:SAM-dependent methyltransferase